MATPAPKTPRQRTAKKTAERPKPTPSDSNEPQHQGSSSKTMNGQRIIKKYPNRRLYDTKHSTYVTLFDIKGLVMSQEPFIVQDAKTGEEITRSILMQIILEEESNGHPLFSTQSLTQMIRFYGNSLQGMMAPFLEQNLNQFIEVQNQYVAHCQKIGSISSPESWSSFLNNTSSPQFVNPMSYFMNAGTQFWEQIQSQTPSIIPSFPFKPFKP
jgi:polyhydroxyalkanoate synthesis repressor PhaR